MEDTTAGESNVEDNDNKDVEREESKGLDTEEEQNKEEKNIKLSCS
jgi:hypothetical protein